MNRIAQFVRDRRKNLGLTQLELAEKAGVGLRFVRNLEQGKESIRLDKANAVLALFSCEAGPVEMLREFAAEAIGRVSPPEGRP